MRPIASLQPPARPVSPFATPSTVKPTGADQFADLLVGKVEEVNQMQLNANEMIHSYLTGGNVNEAEALTAVQKADLAFRMLLQIRNKLVEAYREVQQIQI